MLTPPRAIARALEAGVGWGDAIQHQAIRRHADVLDEIGDLGRVQSRIAAAVRQPYSGPYTGC